jgi:hypothetical protein
MTSDISALSRASMVIAANRGVLHDAFLDVGLDIDFERIFATGGEDAAEMVDENRDADPGPDGWDGMLLDAIGHRGCCRLFGIPEDTDTEDDLWKVCMAVYVAGSQYAVDAAIAGS